MKYKHNAMERMTRHSAEQLPTLLIKKEWINYSLKDDDMKIQDGGIVVELDETKFETRSTTAIIALRELMYLMGQKEQLQDVAISLLSKKETV